MTDRKYDNSGIISKNKKKVDPKHPDITGQGMVDGVEMWIDGWQKSSDKGGIFYTLRFKPKEPKQPQGQAGGGRQQSFQEDDDMPF